jgi:hypothetical protein
VQQFFAASRGQFFAGADKNESSINLKWLQEFCARCRDRERGML